MTLKRQNDVSIARFERRNDVSVSTTSALSAAVQTDFGWVRINNQTGDTVFVRPVESGGTVTTANGMPVPDGFVEWLLVGKGQFLAAIMASGSGTLYVTEHGL